VGGYGLISQRTVSWKAEICCHFVTLWTIFQSRQMISPVCWCSHLRRFPEATPYCLGMVVSIVWICILVLLT
jgi:hypothetical protein